MAWTYVALSSTEADTTLWGKVINSLNGLTNNDAVLSSVKIGTLNSLTYDAQTVIFYNPELTTIPDSSTLSSVWNYQWWSQETNYTALYDSVVGALNDSSGKLTETQKFWARVSVSDRNSNAATATLWYRSQS